MEKKLKQFAYYYFILGTSQKKINFQKIFGVFVSMSYELELFRYESDMNPDNKYMNKISMKYKMRFIYIQ